ncbi:MAG TPA: hypothetical protein VK619_10290 [Pyrinomonadaceae bacterium]|nr:hypothetical protein [Pyrinomonadaceae bacterium]
MKTTRAINLMRATLLAFSLILVPLAVRNMAQNTNTPPSTQSTQSGAAAQSSRQTSTTTQSQPTTTSQTTTTTTRPTDTTTTQNGINPMWIVLGVVALLAILLIAILSMRGRSRGGDTVYERKTTVKRE